MKVKILDIDASDLKCSAGGLVVTFLYKDMRYTASVSQGQDLKEGIKQAIDDRHNLKLQLLEAKVRAEQLKGLVGTELDIGEDP